MNLAFLLFHILSSSTLNKNNKITFQKKKQHLRKQKNNSTPNSDMIFHCHLFFCGPSQRAEVDPRLADDVVGVGGDRVSCCCCCCCCCCCWRCSSRCCCAWKAASCFCWSCCCCCGIPIPAGNPIGQVREGHVHWDIHWLVVWGLRTMKPNELK